MSRLRGDLGHVVEVGVLVKSCKTGHFQSLNTSNELDSDQRSRRNGAGLGKRIWENQGQVLLAILGAMPGFEHVTKSPVTAALHTWCYMGLGKTIRKLKNKMFPFASSHCPHRATPPPHRLSLYWAVCAGVKGRAHRMLRKCFKWILDRESCFHVMNERLFLTSVSLKVFAEKKTLNMVSQTTLVGRQGVALALVSGKRQCLRKLP